MHESPYTPSCEQIGRNHEEARKEACVDVQPAISLGGM